MTDETEVLRIKREALEGLRDWTRSRVETVRDVTQYLREVLPPHAPRKVRAKIMLHDFGEGSSKGFLHSQGSHDSWAVSYGDTILGIHRDDFARMAELVARADANGMVEEGLGAASPKSECQAGEVASTHAASPTDHSDSPAPSPSRAQSFASYANDRKGAMPDETTVTVGQFSEALRAFAPEFCIIGNMTAGQLLAAHAAATARAERAEQRIAELEQCAAFVQWVRQEWHHDGDIDGGALQDALTECGLLTPTEVHAPCDPEACQCAEYGEFPVVCYRWADAARQEAAP